jgi:hypothetical protein
MESDKNGKENSEGQDESCKINLESLNNHMINLDLTKENSKPELKLTNQKSGNILESSEPSQKDNAQSLTEIIEEVVKNSTLSEFIQLKADEVVSANQCIKQLKVEGRVSADYESDLTQLKIKLTERITSKLGGSFNMDQFWKITCGLAEGDTFNPIEVFDNKGEKALISHEKGTVLVIDIWSWYDQIDTFIFAKIAFVNKLNGKLGDLDIANDDIENLDNNNKNNEKEKKN